MGYKFIASILVIVVAVAWGLFSKYWIYLPGIISSLTNPIAPTISVEWHQPPVHHSNKPNVILILVDDLGFNDLSYFGNPHHGVSTPHIDSIAHNGVSFSNAYAGHATCAPSRASLLTGRYPTKIGFEFTPTHPIYVKILGTSPKALRKGIYHKDKAEGLTTANMTLPISEVTIGNALQEAGYHTMHLGKWHLGDTATSAPIHRGFNETLGFNMLSRFLPFHSPKAVDYRLEDMLDKFLWANIDCFVQKDGGKRFQPDEYLTDYFATQASRAIAANKHNPFFMYMSFTAPHTPLQALKADYDALAHIEDHGQRVYGAMLVALDRAVGNILSALKQSNIYDNTMVIFTNDNGAPNWVMQREVNAPYRGWKGTLFEGGIHVPMFIQWPGKISPGTVIDHPVSHIDLFPTILAAAGDENAIKNKYHYIDGVSLLPYLTSVSPNSMEPPHETLYWRSGHYKALRKGKWKLQVAENPNKKWLYNLELDPSEHNNLATLPQYTTVLEEMQLHLLAVDSEQVEPLWPSITETAILIDKLFEHNETWEDEYVYWPN